MDYKLTTRLQKDKANKKEYHLQRLLELSVISKEKNQKSEEPNHEQKEYFVRKMKAKNWSSYK